MFKLFASSAYAQLKTWEEGGGLTATEVAGQEYKVANFKALEVIFSNLLNIIVILAGIVVFVMLLIGGFGLLTSAGNPEKTKKAGGTIANAIIGLIVLLAIWFIFRFIETFTGITITQFEVPGPNPSP